MRAYVFDGSFGWDALRAVERPDPVPGERDVVLRMRAAALNYRDLAILRGRYHAPVSPPLIPPSRRWRGGRGRGRFAGYG